MWSDVADRTHPRLFWLVVVGLLGLLLAGLVAALGGGGPGSRTWAVRVGFLGFLLLVFGLAGYLALGVFEQRPEP